MYPIHIYIFMYPIYYHIYVFSICIYVSNILQSARTSPICMHIKKNTSPTCIYIPAIHGYIDITLQKNTTPMCMYQKNMCPIYVYVPHRYDVHNTHESMCSRVVHIYVIHTYVHICEKTHMYICSSLQMYPI